MSCEFYFVCDTHKNRIRVGSTGLSGFKFFRGEPECMAALHSWLDEHHLCSPLPRMAHEYEMDEKDYTETEW